MLQAGVCSQSDFNYVLDRSRYQPHVTSSAGVHSRIMTLYVAVMK